MRGTSVREPVTGAMTGSDWVVSGRQAVALLALALWNGKDPILKERLVGLKNRERNHGEDVKAYYVYLDSTPTHSYRSTCTSILRLPSPTWT
jgi:hypothetical protein